MRYAPPSRRAPRSRGDRGRRRLHRRHRRRSWTLADAEPTAAACCAATTNSGGCGTPRNDGLRAASGRYVMFLDSDDVLPPGAVDALLAAALEHHAPVAAGACVRRELPAQPRRPLAARPLPPSRRARPPPKPAPQLVHDTLCVNKLYARTSCDEHGITFPDGRFAYEDFVFTARVLAAAPAHRDRPRHVYIWHVRRSPPPVALARPRPDSPTGPPGSRRTAPVRRRSSWTPRTSAAHARRTKFLDHDLRMYVRELNLRSPDYRAEWWGLTRAYLATSTTADCDAAPAPGRVVARVMLASDHPRDLARLNQLAARPARLLPPYARPPTAARSGPPTSPRSTLEHSSHAHGPAPDRHRRRTAPRGRGAAAAAPARPVRAARRGRAPPPSTSSSSPPRHGAPVQTPHALTFVPRPDVPRLLDAEVVPRSVGARHRHLGPAPPCDLRRRHQLRDGPAPTPPPAPAPAPHRPAEPAPRHAARPSVRDPLRRPRRTPRARRTRSPGGGTRPPQPPGSLERRRHAHDGTRHDRGDPGPT